VLQPARGTRDLLPESCEQFYSIIEVARKIFAAYGFGEIQTPIFEFADVFQPVGESSDIISKETYSFDDRSGQRLTLRPEGTAPVARAVISNKLTQATPLKLFYQGPMFRYERPQKGRYRQFHQVGVELIGSPSPLSDVEVIALSHQFLSELGIKDSITLELNSLGNRNTREAYRTALSAYLQPFRKDLSQDSQMRLEKNPLRILDSKDRNDQKIVKDAPIYHHFLDDESKRFFNTVCEGLGTLNIPFTLNEKLVRGLDYYTHNVFEFTTQELGAQGAVLAGGRYNGVIEALGGPSLSGTGWAAGLERLALLTNILSTPPRPTVIIPIDCEDAFRNKKIHDHCLVLMQRLRNNHKSIEMLTNGNLNKKMKRANKLNAQYAILIGEDEIKTHHVLLKDLDKGGQQSLSADALHQYL